MGLDGQGRVEGGIARAWLGQGRQGGSSALIRAGHAVDEARRARAGRPRSRRLDLHAAGPRRTEVIATVGASVRCRPALLFVALREHRVGDVDRRPANDGRRVLHRARIRELVRGLVIQAREISESDVNSESTATRPSRPIPPAAARRRRRPRRDMPSRLGPCGRRSRRHRMTPHSGADRTRSYST